MAETTDANARSPHRPRLPVIVGAVVLVAAVGGWLLLRPHGAKDEERFTGYVVSDDIYMTSPVAGTLTGVAVQRGQRVTAGQALFRVDPTVRAAQTDQARAQIAGAQAQVQQQQAARDHAQADLAAAQADVDSASAQLRRQTGAQRDKPGSVAQLEIDQTRATYEGALQRRDAARTQVTSAAAAIAAARAQVREATAGLVSSKRELSDLSPTAPTAGRVEDVMFKPGESVSANVPVVSIVPDGQVKVRFYVPEALVHAYHPGRQVAIACDGCAAGMTAKVNFVASSPEYTPPIIYSLDARQKLVFLVEAMPSNPRALLPGQPLDVAPTAAGLRTR